MLAKILFVFVLFVNNGAKGYFGLTGKEQLRDVWSIDLNSASLATAGQLDNWDEPAPSTEYRSVDLSLDSVPSIPVKTKRVASRPNTGANYGRTDITSSNSDIDGGSRTSSSTNRPAQTQNSNQRNYQRSRDVGLDYPHEMGQHTGTSHIRRATPSVRPQYFYRYRLRNGNQNQARPNGGRTGSGSDRAAQTRYENANPVSPTTHRSHTTRDTQAARYYRPQQRRPTEGPPHTRRPHLVGSSDFDVAEGEGARLSRHMAMLMNQSGSLAPVSRSERESGKRRYINGFGPNPKSYLVASTVTQQFPSQVRHRIGMGYVRRPTGNRESLASRESTNNTRTAVSVSSSDVAQPFLGVDEATLQEYLTFMGKKMGNATLMLEPEKINRKVARKMCDTFKLTTNQRKKCRKDPGLPQVLTEAIRTASAECQFQFRYERWNCSLGTSRIHLLNKGNKETAFLYSISSAGLTYSVARACANGHLEKCTCEESFDDHENHKTWLWGGCGDNVMYAAKFVRSFLKSRSNMDIRAEVDKHNSNLGIRVVKSNVLQTCKCHGVSGSCSTQTCWRKVAPFYEIGRKIKRAYDKAVKVESVNSSTGRTQLVRLRRRRRRRRPRPISSATSAHITSPPSQRQQQTSARYSDRKAALGSNRNPNIARNNHHTRATTEEPITVVRSKVWENMPRKKELVYLDNSPTYCRKTKFSLGTKGRLCENERNCDAVCCGRGYTTHIKIVRISCKCKVEWCCNVQCKTCTERKQIHTCK